MIKDAELVIIIPTYNEGKNIPILLKRIYQVVHNASVILVDDSDLQKNALMKRNVRSFRNVQLVSRLRKLGRGSAVVTGFKEALKNKRLKYFFEMDADLAHDPVEFPKFFSKINSTDLVIGSRYLDGSRIQKWPLSRLVLSKLINKSLKMWLGVDVSDYTNGFRLYTRTAVDFLADPNSKETRFIALSEIAYKLKKAGFRITEVPITFTDRIYGKSNAGVSEHIHAFWGVLRIKFSS